MNWTPEEITRLKQLWSEGLTTAAIGNVLKVSKNAVIGKAHRLALTPRQSPIVRAPTQRDTKAGPAKKKVAQIFRMADLTSQTCRWPSGDPKEADFQFCGKQAEHGRPYCTHHCNVGYVAAKPKIKAVA